MKCTRTVITGHPGVTEVRSYNAFFNRAFLAERLQVRCRAGP